VNRPAAILAAVGTAISCGGDSHIVNGYQSPMGIQGTFRGQAHSGVDFEGDDGDPVLAAADGVVADQIDAPHGVGTCVLVEHHCPRCDPAIFFTSYCHLQRSLVTSGQLVVRGQEIAKVGHSGPFSGGVSHLHFSMCKFPCTAAARDGDFTGTFDPTKFDVGCFETGRDYVLSGRPVLTHPIACTGR